jgi:hypothetical protein
MRRFIPLFLAIIVLALVAWAQTNSFSRYKRVEAYEVRPGVLMMPQYSADGQVCAIGLDKRRYSPEVIRVNPEFTQKEIDEILNELVPSQERGPKKDDFEGNYMIISGSGMITTSDYENVSVQTYIHVSNIAKERGTNSLGWPKQNISGETVAGAILWKNRKCN